jgi:hypothetical protein
VFRKDKSLTNINTKLKTTLYGINWRTFPEMDLTFYINAVDSAS